MGHLYQLFLGKGRSWQTLSLIHFCRWFCAAVKRSSPGGGTWSSGVSWNHLALWLLWLSVLDLPTKVSFRSICGSRTCLLWLPSLLYLGLESHKSNFGSVKICQLSKAAVIYHGKNNQLLLDRKLITNFSDLCRMEGRSQLEIDWTAIQNKTCFLPMWIVSNNFVMVFNIKGAWDSVFGKYPITQCHLHWASLCTWECS